MGKTSCVSAPEVGKKTEGAEGPLFTLPELENLVRIESALRVCPEVQALFAAAEVGLLKDSGISGFVTVVERFQASLVRRALAARRAGQDLTALAPLFGEVAHDVLTSAEDTLEALGALPPATVAGLRELRRAGWEHPSLAPLQLSVRANRYRESPLQRGSAAPDAALARWVARSGGAAPAAAGEPPLTLFGALRRAARAGVPEGAAPNPVLVLGVSYS
jgi:hypothetical protein